MKTLIVAALVAVASLAQAQTPAERSAFRALYADRVAACEAQAGNDPRRSMCQCQLNVFAERFTREEMHAVNRLTFDDRNSTEAEGRLGVAAIRRVLPERQRSCGF